jgi:DNA-binding CsgD family transcriptional regulator
MTPVAGAEGLIERRGEAATLAAAVTDACAGAGSVVLIEGPPGIGKSALCAHARGLAEQQGMTVLSARGGELERDVTYGVVRVLLERSIVQASPAERRRLLAGPAELALAAFSGEGTAVSPSPETGIDHGLFWLVCNIAASGPVALIVDDAHWSDPASLRFLLHLARRIDGLPLLLIVGTRTHDRPDSRALDLLLMEPAGTHITPAPLTEHGAAQLVSLRLGARISEPVSRACHEMTNGNPFFLREIAGAISETLTGPESALIAQIRSLAPPTVTRSILLRLGRQSPDARAVAEAMAVAGEEVETEVLQRMIGRDRHSVVTALAELGAAGIVSVEGALRFEHPIVRRAIYQDLPEVRRRNLHASAAAALVRQGAAAEDVAHHYLLTDPALDPAVVETLRTVAKRALFRGASDTAVRLLARALSEPPPAEERAATLIELGRAEILGGHAAEAADHLREALEHDLEPSRRVAAALLLGSALMTTATPAEALSFLEAQSLLLDGEDALRLDVERVMLASWIRGSAPMPWFDGMLESFERFAGETQAERLALAMAALAAAYDPAGSAERCADLARRALGDGALVAEQTDGPATGMAAYALVLAEDFDGAEAEIASMFSDARTRGSRFGFAAVEMLAGQIGLATGRLATATADFEAAIATSRSVEESPITQRCIAFADGWLIELLLVQGRSDEARAAAATAEAAGDFDRPEMIWSLYGRGLIRLELDADPAAAAEDFLAVGAAARAGGYEDRSAPWRHWGALALDAAGRHDEATALADEQLQISSRWSPAARGSALRVSALVGAPDRAVAGLEEAVELLTDTPFRLELARALVDLGIAQRRARSRSAARSTLERAMDVAARCEAMALVERARSELRILGARPRRLMFSGLEGLTAAERRVASMAAEGLTNRQIAHALFVTTKSVEGHLSSVYRKLGIGSRAELPNVLANAQAPAEVREAV